MALTELNLVTIITERIFRDDIVEEIKSLGATGYTLSDTTGAGSKGVRASDWEGKNVKIEVLVNQEVSNKIINAVAEKYFEDYSVIAYVHPVQVVRGDKYL